MELEDLIKTRLGELTLDNVRLMKVVVDLREQLDRVSARVAELESGGTVNA